jgi:hypothetical protein
VRKAARRRAKKAAGVVAWGWVGLCVCGCGVLFPMPGSRTCDQGCSSTAQAVGKILADNLQALNPDDVQVLADLAVQISGIQIPAVTNEQAGAAISFLRANGITTLESLQAKIEEAEVNPGAVVIPPDVLAVLEAIAADPTAYAGLVGQVGI